MSPSTKSSAWAIPLSGPSLQPHVGKAHASRTQPGMACCSSSVTLHHGTKSTGQEQGCPHLCKNLLPNQVSQASNLLMRSIFHFLTSLTAQDEAKVWITLQLIPCYHTSGLMWIRNEAREAARSRYGFSCFRPIYEGCSGSFKEQSEIVQEKRKKKDYLPISK